MTTTSIRNRRPAARAALLAAAVTGLVILGVVVTVLALGRGGQDPPSSPFAAHRPAWESAMRKAGVSATYPQGPVDVESVRHKGAHSFSATFTPREIAALLSVYRFRAGDATDAFGLRDVEVQFPEAGVAELDAQVLVGGETYRAHLRTPATFASGDVVLDPSGARLTVEGFSVGRGQRDEAVVTLSDYTNGLIDAAPGLEVARARIVTAGIEVEGVAADSLMHPEPLAPSEGGAYARR